MGALVALLAAIVPTSVSAGTLPTREAVAAVTDALASPAGDSFWIASGVGFVNGLTVDLGFGPPTPGPIEAIRVSNEISGDELVDPESFGSDQTIEGWRLRTGDDGERTVYAQVRSGGEWSPVMSDTIVLDTIAPVGHFELVNEFFATGDPWSAKMAGIEAPFTWMDVQDASFARGGAVRIGTAVDDFDWRVLPPDSTLHREHPDTIQFYHEISWFRYYDRPVGPMRLKARWSDEAGNWSAVQTYTIDIREYLEVATLFVDGDEAVPDLATNSATSVELRIRIDHMPIGPDGQVGSVEKVRIGGDYEGPSKVFDFDGRSEITIDWSLIDDRYGYTSDDGLKRIWVRLYPSVGRTRDLGRRLMLDRVTPTSDEPVAAVAIGSVVGGDGAATASRGMSIKGTVSWRRASDRGRNRSGIAGYRLERSDDGRAWRKQATTKASVTKAPAGLSTSRASRFRVRAADKAGNRSRWQTGLSMRPRIIPEGSSLIRYTGRWTNENRGDALGGKLRTTTTINGSAALSFTGTGIAWVAPRSPNGDSVDVYIDGKRVKVVHLVSPDGSGYQPRRVVFSTAWSKRGKHTIRIVHRYAGHELPLDAFIVLR